jgi:hypothetical protein
MIHDLPTDDQDPDDPVTFINTYIKAAFQEMCRQVSFDALTGKATTVIVITAGTPITSKAQLEVSRGMAWR